MSISKAGSAGLETDTDPFTDQPPPPFEQQQTIGQQCLLAGLSDNDYHSNSNFDEEAPPEFSAYNADYFETSTGDIISHDHHLNTDGEALYRFLLSQANRSPLYCLHCRGTHQEYRTRWVRETNDEGRTDSRRETYTETVTDFDFYIHTGPPSSSKPIHWSVADSEPAFRGLMVQETELCGIRQKTKRAGREKHKKWAEERRVRGLPPWTTWTTGMEEWIEGLPEDSSSLRSSKSLRQWADEYCASQKYLKEFKYKKGLYGWNLQQIESDVRSAIQATTYDGNVEVDISTYGLKIVIRPDNRLSRMLSNKWFKFLSILLLVFPFIWLFKRFHSRGGGRWEICGGAYALKRRILVEIEDTAEEGSQSRVQQRTTSTDLQQVPRENYIVVGVTEGEWFRRWEPRIIRGVLSRYQSSTPIFDTGDHYFF